MKRIATPIVALLIVTAIAADRPGRPASAAPPAAMEDGIRVYFSPEGGCEAAIVAQLNSARKSVDMQAYSFTNTAIARAIAEAKDRGVKVRAILDKKATGDQYSGATYLADHGIDTWTDGQHPIAHNKV